MRNGFTLIELIISIGIVAIISSIGFINLVGYNQRKNIGLVGQEVVAVLRSAQNYSTSQESGSQWGVHFENSTSSEEIDFYELFAGSSYSGSTVMQKVPLESGVIFSSPSTGESLDIVFSAVTGLPGASSTIKVTVSGNESVSSTIIINSNGQIQY